MLTLSRGARCFSTARLVEKPQRSFPLSVKSELVLRFKDICSSNKSTDDLKNALYGLLALKNKDLTKAIITDFIDSKKEQHFSHDSEAFTIALQCLQDCGDKVAGRQAIQLYERVLKLSSKPVPPAAATTTTPADGGGVSSKSSSKKKHAHTVHVPNEQHATVLLSALRSAGLYEEGLQIYKNILEDPVHYPGAASNAILGNSALRLYTSCSMQALRDTDRGGAFESALALFNRMKAVSDGVKPSVHANNYGTMLLLAGRAQRIDVIDTLWGEMTEMGLQSTVYSLTAKMNALLYFPPPTNYSMGGASKGDVTLGHFPDIIALYREILRLGLKPSIQTLQVVLNACDLYGFPGLGLSLFVDWERSRGGNPDWALCEKVLRLMGYPTAYPLALKDVKLPINGLKKFTEEQWVSHCSDAFSRIYPLVTSQSVLQKHLAAADPQAVSTLVTQMAVRGNLDVILAAVESTQRSTSSSSTVVGATTAAAAAVADDGGDDEKSSSTVQIGEMKQLRGAAGAAVDVVVVYDSVWKSVAAAYVKQGRWRDLLSLTERLKCYALPIDMKTSSELISTASVSVSISPDALRDITKSCIDLLTAKGHYERAETLAKLQL